MRCSICSEKMVIATPGLCKGHFIGWVENVVRQTIEENDLIPPKGKVGVAVSGGKDSMALLHILRKFGYSVQALCVDEGIKGYRDTSMVIVQEFCKKAGIPLIIKSFENHFGKSLDDAKKNFVGIPCRLCGAWRRALINMIADGCDVVATGHNLD